jgi:thiol-disulfide isomerase/thioredoxin
MRRWIVVALLLLAPPAVLAQSPGPAALRPFVRGSWQALRAQHQGQPTIVHFWGITCGPCLTELPQWAALLRARPDLDLVLVDADPVPEASAGILDILARNRLASVENWIVADAFEEKLRYEIDPHWHGEMPYTVLIARDGSVSSFVGEADFARLRRWLDAQGRPRS